MLKDMAHGRAGGHPDLTKVLGGSGVVEVLGALTTDRSQGPIEGAHDVGDRHLRRWAVESIAAIGSPLACDDARLAQLPKDSLEELQRDVLGLGHGLALDQPGGFLVVGSRELHQCPHSVVGLGGDMHLRIVPFRRSRPTKRAARHAEGYSLLRR